MASILYIGFGALINAVKNKIPAETRYSFVEIAPLNIESHDGVLQGADVFLIGPLAIDPIRQAQRANQKNPFLSVIMLVFPEQFVKVKQSLLLAYRIGKNTLCLSFDVGNNFNSVLENAVLKTKQRRSFSKLSTQAVTAVSASRPKEADGLALHWDALFNTAPLGAIVLDKDQYVYNANLLSQQYFHSLAEKKEKIHVSDLFPQHPSIATLPPAGAAFSEIVKMNNKFLEVKRSAPVSEQQEHYLLLVNDVTDKIKIENELKAKIEELEFLNQELDQFVDIISHDFKTPLTSIGLLIELASREEDAGKKQQFIQRIKTSSDKLKDLLKGLNVLVDLKNGKSDKVEWVDFSERLSFITGEFQHHLTETGGRIVADFSEAPGIRYFKPHIDSYLSNLITNSIKYQDSNRPLVITIYSRKQKEYVKISVRDNGIGIDLTKNLNKLFQPFKRLTDFGTGSGLGLSIIKRMIERDHGYMEVYSQPGEGTEFIAYLKEQ